MAATKTVSVDVQGLRFTKRGRKWFDPAGMPLATALTRALLDARVRADAELARLRAENAVLGRERKQLARLAADTPQFFNPLEAWSVRELRDRILAEADHA